MGPTDAGDREAPDRQTPGFRMPDWETLTALAVLTLMALALRVALLSESLWLDELHTAWTVAGSGSDLPARALAGNTGPAWFYLPAASVGLFGWSEAALRLPSLVAGLLVLPALFFVVRRMTSSNVAALFAAAAAAVDPSFLHFSVEARAYSAVQLTSIVQIGILWTLLEQPGPRRAVGLAIVSALLVHLHYTAALLLIAEGLFAIGWLCVSRTARASAGRALLGAAALTLVLCLPAVPHVLEVGRRRDAWSAFILDGSLSDLFSLFPLGRYGFAPLALLAMAWLASRFIGERWRLQRVSGRAVALCLTWLAVPALLVWLSTRFGVAALFEPRYVVASAAAPLALAALALAALANPIARVGCAVFVASLCVIASPLGRWAVEGRIAPRVGEGWRSAVSHINADREHRDLPVLLRSGLIESDRLRSKDYATKSALHEFSLLPVATLYALTPPERSVSPLRRSRSAALSAAQIELVLRQAGAWLLIRGSERGAADIAARIREGFAKQGHPGRVSAGVSYGSVRVYQFVLDGGPTDRPVR